MGTLFSPTIEPHPRSDQRDPSRARSAGSASSSSVVFALAIACGLYGSSGCQRFEPFEDSPAAPAGKRYELSLVGAENCPLPANLDPANVKILSYKVRLVSGDERGVPANYFYASLLCTDGARYLADYQGCSPLFSGHPAQKGESREGFLNFPVPPSKTPERIVYRPELLGSGDDSTQEIFVGDPPGEEEAGR